MTVEFRPLDQAERAKLRDALQRNVDHGEPIRMDGGTRFLAEPAADESIDALISAIRSVPCHYADDRANRLALTVLRESPEYLDDAREGCKVGNSVVGSLLSLQHGIPRQYAEQAVADAVAIIDSSNAATIADEPVGGNYTLRRSGQPPLTFRGALIAESDGERQYGREQDRWHELAIYRTAGGKYVAVIRYRTRWQGEADHDEAEPLADAAAVAAYFRAWVPTKFVRGFPVGEHYEGKQERLLADIANRYYEQVADLLSGDEFAEVIE